MTIHLRRQREQQKTWKNSPLETRAGYRLHRNPQLFNNRAKLGLLLTFNHLTDLHAENKDIFCIAWLTQPSDGVQPLQQKWHNLTRNMNWKHLCWPPRGQQCWFCRQPSTGQQPAKGHHLAKVGCHCIHTWKPDRMVCDVPENTNPASVDIFTPRKAQKR